MCHYSLFCLYGVAEQAPSALSLGGNFTVNFIFGCQIISCDYSLFFNFFMGIEIESIMMYFGSLIHTLWREIQL